MDCEELKQKFLNLKTRTDVANILGIKDKSLRYFLYGRRTDNMYHEFTIPKNNGEERKIHAPERKLKMIQRNLADILNCVYRVKPAAHGFVTSKNIVTNAYNHERRKYVLNLDLEDFFGQIHFGRIKGMLINPPYRLGDEAALVISQLACYRGKLPQGAPSSPILSNMICSPLDTQLTKLAKKYKLKYSRYADDITFSSFKEKYPKKILVESNQGTEIGSELESILKKNSFPINYKKLHMFDYRKRQMVTGLVVNQFANLPREYIKEIRAILHSCEKNGIVEAARKFVSKGKCKNTNILKIIQDDTHKEEIENWFLQVLKGKVEYIKNIRGSDNHMFLKYAKEINRVWNMPVFKGVDEQLMFLEKIEKSVFILESKDESNYVQGSGFLAKNTGLFTNYHVIENNDFYTVKTYKNKEIATISTEILYKSGSKSIDYALFKVNKNNDYAWDIGDSNSLAIGDEVIVIGFPDYYEGNTPDIQNAEISSTRTWMQQELYTVDKRIVHGASGGLVLNKKNKKVVGIIKCGASTFNETENTPVQGFIPINIVLKNMI